MGQTKRENITVLVVCSASGTACDPLIVFKGKNFMTSWFGENALHIMVILKTAG